MNLQSIETAPRDETDVLLFGPVPGGFRERPPIVAGWYKMHTDVPGWYTYDDPDNVIDMEPTHWASIPQGPRIIRPAPAPAPLAVTEVER